jgi:hypothetical protein
MPLYEVHFRCDDCKREHTIHTRIHLSSGPERKQSYAEFFGVRPIPPQASSIKGHKAFCLLTGRPVQLNKDDQIYLVPPTIPSLAPRQLQLIPESN